MPRVLQRREGRCEARLRGSPAGAPPERARPDRKGAMPNAHQTLVYEKTGPVAQLTLNRPDRRNGMTNRMLIEATEVLLAAAEDRELRVLVLTGAGSSFCPGADLNVVAAGPAEA